jgi:hypothetical protein
MTAAIVAAQNAFRGLRGLAVALIYARSFMVDLIDIGLAPPSA